MGSWTRIGVEGPNELQQLLLSGCGRKVVLDRPNADLLAGLALVSDVDGRCRIVAHAHDGEPRRPPGCRELFDTLRDFCSNQRSDLFAVDDHGARSIALFRRGVRYHEARKGAHRV